MARKPKHDDAPESETPTGEHEPAVDDAPESETDPADLRAQLEAALSEIERMRAFMESNAPPVSRHAGRRSRSPVGQDVDRAISGLCDMLHRRFHVEIPGKAQAAIREYLLGG